MFQQEPNPLENMTNAGVTSSEYNGYYNSVKGANYTDLHFAKVLTDGEGLLGGLLPASFVAVISKL